MSELKTNYGLLLQDVMSRIVAAKMSCVKSHGHNTKRMVMLHRLLGTNNFYLCSHVYVWNPHCIRHYLLSGGTGTFFFSIYDSSRQRSCLYLSLVNIGYNIEADMLSLWRFQLRIVLSHWTKNRDLGHPNVLSAQSAVNWITFASTYTYA